MIDPHHLARCRQHPALCARDSSRRVCTRRRHFSYSVARASPVRQSCTVLQLLSSCDTPGCQLSAASLTAWPPALRSVLVAALSDAATLRLVTLSSGSAAAGASSSGGRLQTAHRSPHAVLPPARRDGFFALLSQPPSGGAGGRELAAGGFNAHVVFAGAIQLCGRQDESCVARGAEAAAWRCSARRRMVLSDVAQMDHWREDHSRKHST